MIHGMIYAIPPQNSLANEVTMVAGIIGIFIMVFFAVLVASYGLDLKNDNDTDQKLMNGDKPSIMSELVGMYHPIYQKVGQTNKKHQTLTVTVSKLDTAFVNDERFAHKQYKIEKKHTYAHDGIEESTYTVGYATQPTKWLNKYQRLRDLATKK